MISMHLRSKITKVRNIRIHQLTFWEHKSQNIVVKSAQWPRTECGKHKLNLFHFLSIQFILHGILILSEHSELLELRATPTAGKLVPF